MNKETLSADIIENKSVKEYSFGSVVVLTSNIDNFSIKVPNRYVEFMINKSLFNQQQLFILNNVKVLYPQAVQDYKNSLLNGYPFNPYGAFLSYSVTYNENCLLSFYYDTYQYTGGAHGTTIRKSDTYSLISGKEIPLTHFFDSQTNYRKKILDNILEQADARMAENPGIFFDDYRALIKKYFNAESYYLSPDGIVIYFGQYEIAPYVTGIVEFTLPYTMVDFPPKCPK